MTGGIAVVLACAQANAAGLGQLTVHSQLNQPFRASLVVRGGQSEQLRWDCRPSLAPIRDLPGLPDPRVVFAETSDEARAELLIATTGRVLEPVLGLNVVLDCGARGQVSREYSVLLDPPGRLADLPAADPAQVAPVTPLREFAGGRSWVPVAPETASVRSRNSTTAHEAIDCGISWPRCLAPIPRPSSEGVRIA